MKPETANALYEMGKALAKSQGFDGEVIMTINCRSEEVPAYFYEMDEKEMNQTISNYLEQIESEYSRIRGKYSPLSPMDWQLAQKWEDAGIPLHIVLTAMSEVFRKFEASKKGGKINSLSYFTQEVEKQFATWKESQVGKFEEDAEDSFDYSSEDRHHFFDYDDYEEMPEPLSETIKQVVLASFRHYKSQGNIGFIESVEKNYTPEDWAWLMENLEAQNND